jgi:MFS family permease
MVSVARPPRLPFRRLPVTWFAYGLQACYAYLLNALGPLMPSLRRELGLSYTLSSLHFSAFALGMIGAGLVGERVVARLGRRHAARLALIGMAVGVGLLVFGTEPAITLLGVMTMSGLGSVLLVVVTATLSDTHPTQRALALTEANVAASVASSAAPLLIGGVVGLGWGWRPALVLAVLALLPLSVLPLPFSSARGRLSGAAPSPRLPAAYWAAWLSITLCVSVEFCFIYWAADFLEVDGGLAPSDAAASVAVFLLAMLLGRILGSRLAHRVTSHALLVASLGVTALGWLAYWGMPWVGLRIGGLFVAGLGVAELYPLTLSLALAAAPDRPDAAAARSSLATGTAILIAPLVLGSLADQTGIRAAYTVVVVLIVGALAAIHFAERGRSTA